MPKLIQFIGMGITGVGLLYGIIENDMKYEFMYLGTGIVIFLIGFIIEKR
ncbi:MAG: hypothetical protein IPP08_09890 [Chlorobiota bacterium]|nr:MAG: hypothetical protein IPP08_09890 [Chlorobiota bacterium]